MERMPSVISGSSTTSFTVGAGVVGVVGVVCVVVVVVVGGSGLPFTLNVIAWPFFAYAAICCFILRLSALTAFI